jgi:hypothetical protein
MTFDFLSLKNDKNELQTAISHLCSYQKQVYLLLVVPRYVSEYPFWMVQVLGLDESIRPAVNKMRRNLLKLLNVGEFDPCATWQDPCISFTLPEVSSSWRNQERMP